MMEGQHEHQWEAAGGFTGRYACKCGVIGYKPMRGKNRGMIVPYKHG